MSSTIPAITDPSVASVVTPTVSSGGLGATASSSTATNSTTPSALSETDFFQIMSAELANQDPSSPTDSTEFISQMAQFSELSALSTMQSELQTLVATDQAQSAPILNGAAMLGKTVTTPTGTGVVQGAAVQDGQVYVTVSGQSTAVPLTNITAITDTPSATSTATTPGS